MPPNRTALAIGLLLPLAADAASFDDLEFLTGHWVHTDEQSRIEENWLPASANTRVASFRWTHGGKVSAIELVIVAADGDDVMLRFKHFDPDYRAWEADVPNTYRLADSSPCRAVFERTGDNARVPVFMIYERRGDQLTFRGTNDPDAGTSGDDLVLHLSLQNAGTQPDMCDDDQHAGQATNYETDVAQFRGNPAGNGLFAARSPGNIGTEAWRFTTGHAVVATPVVADGVVYVGSTDGHLYALDATSGKEQWRFAADAAITSSAAVSGDAVFFQSDANRIYAVQRQSGRLVWSRETGPDLPYTSFIENELWDYWRASPLLAGDTLFVGSGNGVFHALDAASGEERWSHRTDGRIRATAVTDGETVFVGSFDGRFYALDAATGEELWVFATRGNEYFPVGSIQASPVIAGNLVVFGSRDFHVYALDRQTGAEAWSAEIAESWVTSTAAVSEGRVVVGSSDGQAVTCLELDSGVELWTRKVASNVFSSPAIVNGTVYVGNFDGYVLALDLADGSISGGNLVDDRVNSSPWIADGMLFVGSNNGTVYAFTDKAPGDGS